MSDKPLAERLQVKRDRRLATVELPHDLQSQLEKSPTAPIGDAEVVLAFAHDRVALDRLLADSIPASNANAILWIAYPKLSSAIAGDLNRDAIRLLVEHHGLTTVSQIAIDEIWSALRLKRADRA